MSTATPPKPRSAKRTTRNRKETPNIPSEPALPSIGIISADLQNRGWIHATMNRLENFPGSWLWQVAETLNALEKHQDRIVQHGFIDAVAGPTWCDKQKILALALMPTVAAIRIWESSARQLAYAADDEVLEYVGRVFGTLSQDKYRKLVTNWGEASVDVLPADGPCVWYGSDEDKLPDLDGLQLATEVRKLFQTSRAGMQAKVRKKDTPAAAAPLAATPAAGNDPTAGKRDTFRTVSIDQITVATNIRQEFDPKRIAALATEIERDGLLHPLTVRQSGSGFELIAGERRLRAVKKLGWTDVHVKVVHADDQEAKWIQISENLKREDVSPLDKCFAVKQLRDLGMTQKEISTRMEISQPEVSNRERILSLPECILKHIRSGRVAATAARGLCSLQEHSWILEAVSKDIDSQSDPEDWDYHAVWTEQDLIECAEGAVHDTENFSRTRPMDASSLRRYDDKAPMFKPTDQQLKDLRMFTLKLSNRTRTLATNVELWDQLQLEASDGPVRVIGKGKAGSSVTSHEKSPAQVASEFRFRVWKYRINWQHQQLKKQLRTRFDLSAIMLYLATRNGGFARECALLKSFKAKSNKNTPVFKLLYEHTDPVELGWTLFDDWLSQDPFAYGSLTASDIEYLCERLDINVERDWTVDEQFLQMHTKEQLTKLMKEWKYKISDPDGKKSDTIASILARAAHTPLPAPMSLLKAKP